MLKATVHRLAREIGCPCRDILSHPDPLALVDERGVWRNQGEAVRLAAKLKRLRRTS